MSMTRRARFRRAHPSGLFAGEVGGTKVVESGKNPVGDKAADGVVKETRFIRSLQRQRSRGPLRRRTFPSPMRR
jgi:hypothetical protein